MLDHAGDVGEAGFREVGVFVAGKYRLAVTRIVSDNGPEDQDQDKSAEVSRVTTTLLLTVKR